MKAIWGKSFCPGSICNEVANASAAQAYCCWPANHTPKSLYAAALGLSASCAFIWSGGAHGVSGSANPLPGARKTASTAHHRSAPERLGHMVIARTFYL